ncbi:hydantoinase B/oxoprolinase family protein [Conexibacter woesei]|uniref:5-oxoprolinase (ATP-hydrolyzing) n=1 Tax=Conexibacter woesei (strain DSM 14684 / CCUG 47730 / CIP 108061 / JCM 11494 / NBRC 100937 / ID131577) TaxID=469383 RepID=D3F589_CONWI|nr:hydantoinase B/oxoprolinase family protein [Conexibacter woesei]ADB50556.1 5-oxoprolinase (ATP-hydrolyzing) [Conexibacter woesei DSM 14684]
MRTVIEHRGEDAGALSPVELEILRTTLLAYPDELGAVLANAAPTVEISQGREYAIAIADASGAIVATDDPLQTASMAQTVGHVVEYFEFDLHDGDVILTNDPYAGGTRLQDVTLTAPLTIDDELVLFLAARVRVADVGGQVTGSLNPAATEILAEGHPATPVKIQRHGRPVRDMLHVFLLNGRRAEETRRTLEAGIAALELGQRRLTELIGRYGVETVRGALAYAQDYSEQLARNAIAAWEPGAYEGEQTLRLDADAGGPVTVRLAATVDETRLVLDFSRSDDQRQLFVNSSAGSTASCAVGAVLAMLGDTVPANSGLLRAVQVRTRPGSVVHPVNPAPVGWGPMHCGNEVTELVATTLRPAAAHPVPALTVPRPLVLSRPADDRSHQLDLGRWGVGGASAVPEGDGWGRPQLATRAQLPSVEQWETEHAMRIERLELVQDSPGAGRWRGAPGVEAIVVLAPDRLFTLWTQASGAAVGGLAGGAPGDPGEVAFHTPEGWQPAPHSAADTAIAADRLRLRLAGGGGCGDPAERARTAVVDDVLDGVISPATARDVYGLSADELDAAIQDLPAGQGAQIGGDRV